MEEGTLGQYLHISRLSIFINDTQMKTFSVEFSFCKDRKFNEFVQDLRIKQGG